MVKSRAFDLDGLRFAVESALPEHKARADGTVAEFELRAEFSRKARRLQRGQNAHFAEDGHVARQEGFADVKTRKNLLFQHEHAFARPRQKCGRTAAARATSNDQHVIIILIHFNKFDDVMNDGKLVKLR
jgi:hypothetical protein